MNNDNLQKYILDDIKEIKQDQKKILSEIASIKAKLAIVSSLFGVAGSLVLNFLGKMLK